MIISSVVIMFVKGGFAKASPPCSINETLSPFLFIVSHLSRSPTHMPSGIAIETIHKPL